MKKLIPLLIFLAVSFVIFNFYKTKTITEVQAPHSVIFSEIKKYKKPSRVEINTYTDKYKTEIKEIRKLKFSLDPSSQFHLVIHLFSDDTDQKSPLVGQIQFKDNKNNNLILEVNLNLN